MFAAAPEDVGLTEQNGFSFSKPYLPLQTNLISNFRTNDDAKKFFMSSLAATQAAYDANVGGSGRGSGGSAGAKQGNCGYPDASCVKARPELICQIHGAYEVVPEPGSPLVKAPAEERIKVSSTGVSAASEMSLSQSKGRAWYSDYAYDRRSPTCCLPWQWESGQV